MLKRLFAINRRDRIGLACWFLIGFATNLLALVPMVAREVWQHKKCPYNPFEWEDVIRYSLAILVGSAIQVLVIKFWIL